MTDKKRSSDDKDTIPLNSSLESPGWDGPLSLSVVAAVAEKEGTDSAEMTPIHDAVDPDALDALFEGREPGTVSFEYLGYEIVVDEDGSISISTEKDNQG